MSGSPLPGLNLTAGYTYLVTENTKNTSASSVGAPISYWYPLHTLKLWSNYKFGNGALAGFNFGFGVNGQSNTASGTSSATVVAVSRVLMRSTALSWATRSAKTCRPLSP